MTSSRVSLMGVHPHGGPGDGAGDCSGGVALLPSASSDRRAPAIHVEHAELRDQAGRRVGVVRMVLANSAPVVVMYDGELFLVDREASSLIYRQVRAYRADGLVEGDRS